MRKKQIMLFLLAASLGITSGCGQVEVKQESDSATVVEKEADNGTLDKVTISASDAHLEGVTLKDTEVEEKIHYDTEDNCIIGLGEYSTATYITEDIQPGNYDVYLQISKGSSAFVCGSTPVTVSINEDIEQIPCIPIAPCTMGQMGMENEPTYQKDMGLFLLESDVALDDNNTITIGGVPGYEFQFSGNYTSTMPAIGDMILYPTGTIVEQGYDGNKFTTTTTETKDPSDPLSGLDIAWLGSSVTYGQGADGYSMADEIEKNHPATTSYKYAISGTPLANYAGDRGLPTDGEGLHGSYVSRLKQLDVNKKYDLFIVQLSTNDATGGLPMGAISDSKELEDFDSHTVIGAMEYIIAYVQQNWGCPVMFYTGTKFDSPQYADMVDTLLRIKDKWDIGVIDLWNNDTMNDIDEKLYKKYMKEDGIHPLLDGYVDWWTPVFEEDIVKYLTSK